MGHFSGGTPTYGRMAPRERPFVRSLAASRVSRLTDGSHRYPLESARIM